MRPHLLIAEGDSELGNIYCRFFGQRGYEAESARDGLDCLGKLRRRRPTALVLDRQLPWGGGDGIVAWLREEGWGPEIPVVLLVDGMTDIDWMTATLLPPVKQVLRKPFRLAELMDAVRAAAPPAVRALHCQTCS
jgi:DNA-binding response OmpR family regulator